MVVAGAIEYIKRLENVKTIALTKYEALREEQLRRSEGSIEEHGGLGNEAAPEVWLHL